MSGPQIEAGDPTHRGRPVQAIGVDGGPLLLRGAKTVRVDEETYMTPRPVVAVCRCKRTSRPPW